MRVPKSTSRCFSVSVLFGSLLATGSGGCAFAAAGGDAVPDDGEPPCVVATFPEDGTRHWDRDGEVVFVFSEPMDLDLGQVVAAVGPDATPVPFEAAWANPQRTELVAAPVEPLPARTSVAVAAVGFRDVRGTPQHVAHETHYETVDDVAPSLTSSVPSTGSLVDLPLDTIVLAFDEPLDLSPAEATIEGLGAEIERFHWNEDQTEVHLTVRGFLHDERYAVRLTGVRDRFGNDGPSARIGFTIAPDRTAPVVEETFPAEGEIVDGDALEEAWIRLDEPMRTRDNRVVIEVDGVPHSAWGAYVENDRTFTVPLPADARTPGASVSIRLAGLRDIHGNHVDPVPVVTDGRLDFQVAVDTGTAPTDSSR